MSALKNKHNWLNTANFLFKTMTYVKLTSNCCGIINSSFKKGGFDLMLTEEKS